MKFLNEFGCIKRSHEKWIGDIAYPFIDLKLIFDIPLSYIDHYISAVGKLETEISIWCKLTMG